jgi:hypothetical protein
VGSGHHRLELEAARALHDLHSCEDDELSTAGQAYLFGSGDEQTPAPDSLGHRIRQRLDALDTRLAKFVQADPESFAKGAKSVEFTGLPTVIAKDEDQEVGLSFGVRNKGNVDVDFDLIVGTNLGEQILTQSGTLAPAATLPLKCAVSGRCTLRPTGEADPSGTLTAVELRLRHTDQAGKWRDAVDGIVNLPAKVHPKKTKLATDALAGFDDV